MNIKKDKKIFNEHLTNIKSVWLEKGVHFYVPLVKHQLPDKNNIRIRNVMNYGIVDWDVLKVFADIVGYDIQSGIFKNDKVYVNN